jgi:class 3 adenylate cyclase
MVSFRHFRTRLTVLFGGLLAGLMALVLFAADRAQVASAREEVDRALTVTAGVLGRQLDQRSRELIHAAELLSADFAFKAAVATADTGTVLSALENHAARIEADAMLLVDLDGQPLADTTQPEGGPLPEGLRPLLAAANADEEGRASGFATLAGRTQQVVVVPLLAPVPIANIVIGFRFDDQQAAELARVTSSEVALVRLAADDTSPAAPPQVLAASFATSVRSSLATALALPAARIAVASASEPSAAEAGRPEPGPERAGQSASDRAGAAGAEPATPPATPEGAAQAAAAPAVGSAALRFEALLGDESSGGARRYVLALQPVSGESGEPVLAVLARSLDDALAPAMRLRRNLGVLFVVGVSLALLLASAVASSVTRPVGELAAAARRVSAGDLEPRVAVTQRDEIGVLAQTFNGMVEGLAERDRVRSLLGKVVSPEIAHELLARGVELGGEERQVTMLFSDVRGFTTLAEGRTPREVLALLNRYLTRMSAVVERHGGVVDKYVGDAVMALFGAPLAHDDDADRAVATALDMVTALAELNRELAAEGLPPLAIGIGVHGDRVVAGNMGSTSRLNYTVIGDGVNLASRLEGVTKLYGVPVVVSADTAAAARSFVFRELDRVRVKGKREAVGIAEPLGRRDALPAAVLTRSARFAAALAAARRRDFQAAAAMLAALRAERLAGAEDPVVALWSARVTAWLDSPPPAGWDGTTTLSEK